MCGIVGYFQTKSFFNRTDLDQAQACIAHRGPDAHAIFTEGPAGLAHRRLSIIDLSEAANQPFFTSNQEWVIAFNGEVYNYLEITEEIRKVEPSFVPRTHSDTEIIAEAIRIWGADAATRFNGMFAIAAYNRIKEELLVFRDRLGIKPIYYWLHDGVFFFGSELKTLQVLRGKIKLNIDEQAVASYFHLGYVPAPLSIYKEVKKFPQGSLLKISAAGHSWSRFWSPASKIKAELMSNEQVAVARLKELIESSVRYRLISDVPSGTFLSGGIDSSTVTAAACAVSKTRMNTFSIGFKEARYNESSHAEHVAKLLNTNHHSLTVSEDDALDFVLKINEAFDEPFSDGSAFPTMLVSKMARKNVTMVLSGDGGDELFMGYGSYVWANRLGSPLIKATAPLIGSVLSLGSERFKRASWMFQTFEEGHFHDELFSREQYFYSIAEVRKLVKRGQVADLSVDQRGAARVLSYAEKQALFDLQSYLPDDLLVKVDRASMAFSLEVRVPLLDYRIVEFALNLSPALKIKNSIQKHLLKKVLYEYLPAEVFERPKQGFAAPLSKWFRNELRSHVLKYTDPKRMKDSGWLNPEQVVQIREALFNGGAIWYNKLWSVVQFNVFLEKEGLY